MSLAIQYAKYMGLKVIAIGMALHLPTCLNYSHLRPDSGADKKKLCSDLGADKWIDFKETKDLVKDIKDVTGGKGAHAAVVTTASVRYHACHTLTSMLTIIF
jgi:alcohol dehydrogenase, propanol-preferring